ncbi:hypothetical protein NECAME_07377 [Necator americanus]|uniref:Uncharacterized protein n=1 Tax=Necator americanus TaxID=51031 RepID=W2TQW6_NECAM|nr:hypothetical protein NECAME_07377 [Necator americanus]ETN83422.1 hypothetical protein NECAME_07377 [Necator americanus]
MLNPLYMQHRPSTPVSIGPPSSPPSLHNLKEIEELSAERLNLYLDRQEGEDEHEEEAVDEATKKKSRWKRCSRRRDFGAQIDMSFGVNDGGVFGLMGSWTGTRRQRLFNSEENLRIALPHVGLVILSAAYTLLGAAIFHHYEKPFEEHLRNETAHRVHSLKQRIIDDLWEMNNNGTPYTIWAERAQTA